MAYLSGGMGFSVGIGNHTHSLIITGQNKLLTRACSARPFHSSCTFSFVSTLYEYIACATYLIIHPIPVSGSLLRSFYSFYIVEHLSLLFCMMTEVS